MVSFLKGRRRDDDSVVAVDSSGRNVAAALEALVARAEAAANDLRSLAPLLERAAEFAELPERCEEVEQKVAGPERLGSQLTTAGDQGERLITPQTATEVPLGHAG